MAKRKQRKQLKQRPPAAAVEPKLADEIRIMIWEYTWPESRIIEAAFFDNPEYQLGESDEDSDSSDDEDSPIEIVNLRLAGHLSTLIRKGLEGRVPEERRAEKRRDPVALRVCHQSRMHTLKRYRLMPSLAEPFYYHPQRDIFYITIAIADDYDEHMPHLLQYHGTELNHLETVLVYEWSETRAEKQYDISQAFEVMSHLRGLQTIRLLLDRENTEALIAEGNEAGIFTFAEHLRSNFLAVIEDENCTASTIEVMDCKGNVY